jgi:hypothetical protein
MQYSCRFMKQTTLLHLVWKLRECVELYLYSSISVFLLVATLWAWLICVAPAPFVDAVTYEKKFLYSHIVDLYISIYLYYFYLQYCIVLNVLFRHNTLSTYTIKNILLTCGIIFSVFLGPVTTCKFLNVAVAARSVIRENHLSTQHKGGYVWQQIRHPTETGYNQITCGKSYKIQLCLPWCGGCTGEGNLWFNFKFEIMYLIQAVKFLWPTQKLQWPLIFRHSLVAREKLGLPSWEGV